MDDPRKKLSRFGFKCLPFTPEVKELYLNETRKRHLRRLMDFLHFRGFAVITGSPGMGKSMLLDHMRSQLQENTHKVMYIPFSTLGESDMLRIISMKLGIEPMFSRARMFHGIQKHIAEIQPVNPVIVIDEIQKSGLDTIETIRLLANFNFDDRPYISVIMSGTDDFIHHFRLKSYQSLRQRISCFCQIGPLSREETSQYIMHHFRTAGVEKEIITPQAVNNVYDTTAGVPRVINSLMFEALKEAAEDSKDIIGLEHVTLARENILLYECQPGEKQ